jgi:hypothetical protein
MTSVGPAPEHLVVVHHGYGGTHHGHAAFCDQIREQHPSTFVLNCTTNSADGAMKEGVTACAERLVSEVEQQVDALPSLRSISLVGVSMGGLVCRSAAGMMYCPSDGTIGGLLPDSLCCMASPMLGIRKTLPWIARAAFWLFGTRGNQTLTDLTLAEPDGMIRTLEQLTEGIHLDALRAFRRRVVAGATHGDVLCPYATSMLVTGSPNVEPQTQTQTRMVGGHSDLAGHIPELDCEVVEHFEATSLEHEMLTRLRSVSWERYELFVSTEDRIRLLGAHNDRAQEEAHKLLLDTVLVGSSSEKAGAQDAQTTCQAALRSFPVAVGEEESSEMCVPNDVPA